MPSISVPPDHTEQLLAWRKYLSKLQASTEPKRNHRAGSSGSLHHLDMRRPAKLPSSQRTRRRSVRRRRLIGGNPTLGPFNQTTFSRGISAHVIGWNCRIQIQISSDPIERLGSAGGGNAAALKRPCELSHAGTKGLLPMLTRAWGGGMD